MRWATSGIWSTAALIMTIAVITSQNLSAEQVRHTRGVRDVIGQDDLEEAATGSRPWWTGFRRWTGGRRWGAGWLAGGALVVVAATVPPGSRGAPTDASSAADRSDRAGLPSPVVPAQPDHTGLPSPVVPADPVLRGSLAARPLGGGTVRTDAGARGDVRLEIRNGGRPLRLLDVTAEVPGVRFTPVVRPHGVELGTEERIELVLRFRIDDCASLRRTGRLVLQVEQSGLRQEVGLTVTHDREAGTVRQVALDRVLGACPG